MRNQDVSQLVEFGMSEFCRGRNFGECSVRQGLHLGRRTQIVLQIFQYLDQSDVALQEGVVDMLFVKIQKSSHPATDQSLVRVIQSDANI
jgi:hypothetical protein